MGTAAEDLIVRYGREGLSPAVVRSFRKTIRDHYRRHGRDFPWRRTADPYHVLVSEMMLQQTQTQRVLGKYEEFIDRFPDITTLAAASLREILSLWQGLGYNRRALALKRASEKIVRDFDGEIPPDMGALRSLPGIGSATASAILAFAFNRPSTLIETNIRAVFLHFFFPEKRRVSDGEIVPLVEKTVDAANPREWYYALMDYGVMLKQQHVNPSRRSAHHRSQPPFRGSEREVRGIILRALLAAPHSSAGELSRGLRLDRGRIAAALERLAKEGLVTGKRRRYAVA